MNWEKVAAYIEGSLQVIRKYESLQSRLHEKATKVAHFLSSQHLIDPDKEAQVVEELTEDPSRALDMLKEAARSPVFGDPAESKSVSASGLKKSEQAFVEAILG